MQVPVDYPIEDEARHTQFSIDELAYAVYLDRLPADESDNGPEYQMPPVPFSYYPQPKKKSPAPFADVTQSLLAFEANSRMLSRFTTGLSR